MSPTRRSAKKKTASEGGVEPILQGHPRRAQIDALRTVLKTSMPGVVEKVKWNAPSYGLGDDDRITFRLQPGDRVELVFHRGAKKQAGTFAFSDPSGLVKWLAPDRGIVVFADAADVKAKARSLATLAKRWLEATRVA